MDGKWVSYVVLNTLCVGDARCHSEILCSSNEACNL